MRKNIFFIIIALFTIKSTAQHCHFDYTTMYVISVKDAVSNTVINDLKITLVDSLQTPIKNKRIAIKHDGNNFYNYDSVFVFHQNTKKSFPNLTRKHYKNGLPVSKGKYFLLVDHIWNYSKENLFLKINDLSKKYTAKIIALKDKRIVPLCTKLHSTWNSKEAEEKATIHVLLSRKKD